MANLSNINNKFLVTTGGNVLIGKTAANNATVGAQIMSTGDINPTVSGDTVARFNRLSNDGEIIRFQQDTLTDGAINSLSGRIAIGSGTTGIFFDSIRDVVTPHNMTTNAYSANISLGRSAIPFKDLYLSGQVNAVGASFIGAAASGAALVTIENNSGSTATSYGLLVIGGGNSSNGRTFEVRDASGNTDLIVKGNGQVGIGTASPSAKLHVENTNAAIVYVKSTVNNQNASIWFNSNSGGTQADRWEIGTNISAGTDLEFFDRLNSVSRMVIQNDGNVGIGTISPSAKLEVVTTVGADAIRLNYGQSADIFLGFNAANPRILLQDNSNVVTHNFQSNGDNYIVGSNVGIGTTSPICKLDVKGPDTNNAILARFYSSEGGRGDFIIRNGVGTTPTTYIGTGGGSEELSIGSNDTNAIYIDSQQRVGIGTTTFAPTISNQLKLGDMGSGAVGEVLDANVVDGAARMIICSGGATGQVPILSLRHYSAAYGIDIWMYYNSPWNTYIDNRHPSSGFIFRNNCNAAGGENVVFEIGGTGRINMYGLDAKGTTGSDVRFNTSTKEIYYLTSSRRYKTDIVNLESTLDKINALRPVRFKDIKTGEDACGLIAEETFEIIPDVVFTKEIEGFDKPQIEGLNYSDIVPFLIKSIQELKAEIDELKK